MRAQWPARGASGIMIQFPFYAGIQALMDHSAAGVITKWFVDIANVHTFPLLAFLAGRDQFRGAVRRRPLGRAGRS